MGDGLDWLASILSVFTASDSLFLLHKYKAAFARGIEHQLNLGFWIFMYFFLISLSYVCSVQTENGGF